jgi:hypothetical protein
MALTLQALYAQYALRQVDFTHDCDHGSPPLARPPAFLIWHGRQAVSLTAAMAIHKAHPEIPAAELFRLMTETRRTYERLKASRPPAVRVGAEASDDPFDY